MTINILANVIMTFRTIDKQSRGWKNKKELFRIKRKLKNS